MACDFQVTTFVHVEVIFVACFTSTRRFFNEIVTHTEFFLRVMLLARSSSDDDDDDDEGNEKIIMKNIKFITLKVPTLFGGFLFKAH